MTLSAGQAVMGKKRGTVLVRRVAKASQEETQPASASPSSSCSSPLQTPSAQNVMQHTLTYDLSRSQNDISRDSTHSIEASAVCSSPFTALSFDFFIYFFYFPFRLPFACLNARPTARHCGHSHRKLKRQTTSHPVCAFWRKPLPPRQEQQVQVSLAASHVEATAAALETERDERETKKKKEIKE